MNLEEIINKFNKAISNISIFNVSKEDINLDNLFMAMACRISKKSEDPSSKVGAVIVKNDKIISAGYNKFPDGYEDMFSWDKNKDWLHTKYPYVIHAEMYAITHCKEDLYGSKIYVSMYPCNECAKAIVSSGIKDVYYRYDKYPDADSIQAAKYIFEVMKINVKKINYK